MDKLFDLRFAIGLFFVIIGLLLGIYSVVTAMDKLNNVNSWCSILFVLFGAPMLFFSMKKNKKKET